MVLLVYLIFQIIEFYLLFLIAGYIGFLPMLALVFATVFLGISIIKHTSKRLRSTDVGSAMSSMVGNAFGVLAGILLIIPGPISDVLALLVLFPPTRKIIGTFFIGFAIKKFFNSKASSSFGKKFFYDGSNFKDNFTNNFGGQKFFKDVLNKKNKNKDDKKTQIKKDKKASDSEYIDAEYEEID